MVVGLDHKPVISYCMKRLKLFTYSRGGGFVHPYEMGANVYCESIHDEEASEAARRFVQQARYSGPITIEFRRSSVDEKLTFIKADPRFVRATSLSTAIGLDVPTALYRVFHGQRVEAPSDYPDGYAWIWTIWYAEALWRNRANQSVRRELGNLMRTLRNVKSYAYWDWRDPMPFVEDVRRWGALWVGRRFGRKRQHETDTKPPRKGTIPKAARAAGA
jgi:predicted ATP-grasp superfamily ATP-dependent carboligase